MRFPMLALWRGASQRISRISATMSPVGAVITHTKRCLKVLKTLSNLKRRIAAAVLHDKSSKYPTRGNQLSQCPFHLSITSLDRNQDSRSVDTVMTWLDEAQEVSDNRLNEKLELYIDRHLN